MMVSLPITGTTLTMTTEQVTNDITDNTSWPEPITNGDPLVSQLPWKVDVGLASYMTFIAATSIILNGLVLYTIVGRQRKLMSLEVFIVNLSVIDLLHSTVAHPLMVAAAFKHAWPFSRALCHCYAATVFFLGIASISTLAVMSVMRYIKVCHPRIDKHISVKVAAASLIPVYLNATVWSISPFFGWASYGPEPFGLSCTIDWYNPSMSYIISIFLGVYIIPFGAMAVSYGKMVCAIYKAQSNSSFFKSRMDRYLTKMSVIMCSCFLFAWTPYAIAALIYVFCPKLQLSFIFTVMAPFFAKSSTCYNPIVYFFCIKRFRKDLLDVLLKIFATKKQDTQQPEAMQKKCISLRLKNNLYHGSSSSRIDTIEETQMETSKELVGSRLPLLSPGNKNGNQNRKPISQLTTPDSPSLEQRQTDK